jgi:hypothetical protein
MELFVKQYRKLVIWSMGIGVILILLLVVRIVIESKSEAPLETPQAVLQIMPTAIDFPIETPSPSPIDRAATLMGILPTPITLKVLYAATQTQIASEEMIPHTINDLSYDEFIIMPPNVLANMHALFAKGQDLGRDPHAFTRIGDSTIEYPIFLTGFENNDYNLGEYEYLQDVIHFYNGSFDHRSMAVRRGLHTWAVLDPMWAGSPCQTGEHMLACEMRLKNPSIVFIRLGSNDAGIPDMTAKSLREIVAYCIEQGIIPILGTKADRFEGVGNTTNQVIRQIAEDFEVPLWDFDLVANTLPNHGLGKDHVHLTFFFPYDWQLEDGFETGHGLHNLSALIMLDAAWKVIVEQTQ